MGANIWPGVFRLVEEPHSVAMLRRHGLQLLAAYHRRERGLPVGADLADDERRATIVDMTVQVLLERAREAYDGELVVFKGPELARRYPVSTLRPYDDVDLLVADGAAAERALLAAGFESVGNPDAYRDIHHLRPLAWPGLPLYLELHTRPKWVDGLPVPATRDLIGRAVPADVGVAGLLALPPAEHALLVAAHAWAHEPLRRALDLVDASVLADEADERELRALARSWGIDGVWRTTAAAAGALLGTARTPVAMRVWARHLRPLRERSVLEGHLERWLSGFWSLPPGRATTAFAVAVAHDLTPAPDESWREKLRRVRTAVRDAALARSEHDRVLPRLPVRTRRSASSRRPRSGGRPR
jgi:hypothetical protein